MNKYSESNRSAPKSIPELESELHRGPQIGLGKLLIGANLIGIILAVTVITRGGAVGWAALVGFMLPMLVMVVIAFVEIRERMNGPKDRPLASEIRKEANRSPFD